MRIEVKNKKKLNKFCYYEALKILKVPRENFIWTR